MASKVNGCFQGYLVIGIVCSAIVWCIPLVSAATTDVRIVNFAPDNVTVINETTVSYRWMEENLPVIGDGITRYYNQGPVFVDDADTAQEENLRWNAAEDINVREKDMGAVKGTALKDLCELVGGMDPGDTVKIRAEDGFSRTFAYENVYTPSSRQGPMVIAWYHDEEGYVPKYRAGMRLLFLADNTTNPWGLHAFGNADWRESAAPEYWYYYRQGEEKYPTTTGLSVQYVAEILISSHDGAQDEAKVMAETTVPAPPPTPAAVSPGTIVVALAACGLFGGFLHTRGRT
ncbi:MAG TPA: argininosuccinate synthase [Methanoregulaceae archaeon]|nr:argininosuccinate synthase [Methanoregulaceae archaeon]HPD76212.1 argininosuccinate synthase [Methanoregulaceae archaeon]HRY76145.1 argininosuccinate synthase [Methanoregulaceae archaeon]